MSNPFGRSRDEGASKIDPTDHRPEANANVAVAEKYIELLCSLGDTQVIAQKTRLVCIARVRFAAAYPRKRYLLAGFALHRWPESPRIVKREDYGPRWRYQYRRIASEADLDPELRAWLRESHNVVGLQRGLGAGVGVPTPQ